MPARKAPKSRKPVRATASRKTVAKSARTATRAQPAKGRPAARPRAAASARAVRSSPKPARAVARPAAKAIVKAPAVKPAAPARAAAKPERKPQRPVARPADERVKAEAKAAAAPARPKPAVPLMPPVTAVAVARATSRPRPVPAPHEDDDETSGHSLLLGPRNVLPYVERSGEAYMSQEQLEHFQLILNSWKRDLMEEVDRTMNHMKDEAANPPDPNDRASLESEFALELRTRDRERKLIRKIDEALSRIDDGSYGYCLETGEPIGIKRLEARPVATLCIEAQERRERREKQYGDRDDWYR